MQSCNFRYKSGSKAKTNIKPSVKLKLKLKLKNNKNKKNKNKKQCNENVRKKANRLQHKDTHISYVEA